MPDVNVLIYAHRAESIEHDRYANWFTELCTSSEPFALSELVLQGFGRVATNPKIFDPPSTSDGAFRFITRSSLNPVVPPSGPAPAIGPSSVAFVRIRASAATESPTPPTPHWPSKAAAFGSPPTPISPASPPPFAHI